jgi:F-type H+-transporting ATPase subunit epsilon
MATLHVELVSPERVLYSGEADMVIARTVGGGDIAFLPGHAPFVGALEVATVTIRSSGPSGTTDQEVAVHGGFIEVSSGEANGEGPQGGAISEGEREVPGTTVTILSDVAELPDQIDVERARRAQEAAETKLRQGHDAQAEAAARRAHVRLAVAGAS